MDGRVRDKAAVLFRTLLALWGRENISMSSESDSGDDKWADLDSQGRRYQDLVTDEM